MGRRVAADELGQDGELAAGDLDVRRLRADPQPLGDPRERVRVGLLDGEVVEHRDRLGADADDVVDVHRDAVDPDRLEAVGLLGDDDLRADAVRRHRDPEVVGDAQHARVVAAREHGGRRAVELDPRAGRRRARRRRGPPGRVDAGGGVRVAHRRHCVSHARGLRRARAVARRPPLPLGGGRRTGGDVGTETVFEYAEAGRHRPRALRRRRGPPRLPRRHARRRHAALPLRARARRRHDGDRPLRVADRGARRRPPAPARDVGVGVAARARGRASSRRSSDASARSRRARHTSAASARR